MTVKWMVEGPQVAQGLVDVMVVVTAEVHVEDAQINRWLQAEEVDVVAMMTSLTMT